jgi:hypothetical protein
MKFITKEGDDAEKIISVAVKEKTGRQLEARDHTDNQKRKLEPEQSDANLEDANQEDLDVTSEEDKSTLYFEAKSMWQTERHNENEEATPHLLEELEELSPSLQMTTRSRRPNSRYVNTTIVEDNLELVTYDDVPIRDKMKTLKDQPTQNYDKEHNDEDGRGVPKIR